MSDKENPTIRCIHRERQFPHPRDRHLFLVLAELSGATFHPYVVWTYNAEMHGYYHGDYYATLPEAEEGYAARFRTLGSD
jgi:hypothetical protein